MQDNNQNDQNKKDDSLKPQNELSEETKQQTNFQKSLNDDLSISKNINKNSKTSPLPLQSVNDISSATNKIPPIEKDNSYSKEPTNYQPKSFDGGNELENSKNSINPEQRKNENINQKDDKSIEKSVGDNKENPNSRQNTVKNIANSNKKKNGENHSDANSISKNPSRNKFNNISKKHGKHANNEDNTDDKENDGRKESKQSNQPTKQTLKDRILNKNRNSQATRGEQVDEETEEEQSSGEQIVGALGSFIKQKIIILVASNIGIFAIVFLIAIVAVILITANNGGFASEDGKALCYVATKCQTIIIKNGEEEKSYSLDEFISGAIVNYYTKDLFLNDLLGNKDNMYKALGVIIHSDIVYYSNTNESAGTCTITDDNRFKDIYIPNEDISNNTNGSSDNAQTNENDSGNGTTESNSTSQDEVVDNSKYDVNNITDEEIEEAIQQASRLKKYYEKAKTNVESVRNMMVIGYSKDSDLYYDGYEAKLYGVNAKSNYQDIIKDYLPLDDSMKADDKQIVYPICNFNDSSNNGGTNSGGTDIGTIVINNICSQVVVTDNMVGKVYGHTEDYSGVYSYDEFIEGVVANETGYGWSKYPDILKAHAVAARTYFYNAVKGSSKYGSLDGDTCYFTTSTYSMGFRKNTDSAITQAVSDTSGEYIMVNGEISKEARWDAFTYSSKDDNYYTLKQKGLKIPVNWIESRISKGTIAYNNKYSHGAGMSQWGAAYMVMEQNKNYKEVISFFYGADIAKVTDGYVMPINTFTMITGELSVGYCASKSYHPGLDFAAPAGTPVYAATSGVIEKEYYYTYQCLPEYYDREKTKRNPHYNDCVKGHTNYADNSAGQGFKIKNDDGTYSLYFHFSKKENLHKGDRVTAGQKIGEVGTTGKSTGNHLHYEMRPTSTGKPLEPRNYLPMGGYSICHNNPNYTG